jgi:hypothetical protein
MATNVDGNSCGTLTLYWSHSGQSPLVSMAKPGEGAGIEVEEARLGCFSALSLCGLLHILY